MSLFISGFLLTLLFWLGVVTARDHAWRQQNFGSWAWFFLTVLASLAASILFAYSYHEARHFRDPMEVGRLVFGVLLAVVVVLWLLRRQTGYNDNEAAVQAARPLPQRLDATLDAKWTLLLAAILVLAVLFMPHVDRIVDNMQEFKAGGIELKLSVEQGAGNRIPLQHSLEQQYIGSLYALRDNETMVLILDADRRAVRLLQTKVTDQNQSIAAIDSFERFYRAAVAPLVKCVNASLAAGVDVGALKLEIGAIASELATLLHAKEKLKKIASDAQVSIDKLMKRRDCVALRAAGNDIQKFLPPADRDALLRSGWTHYTIGAFFGFADNSILATRYLDGIPPEDLNVPAMMMLATFWDALEQRERAIVHLDQALELRRRISQKACDKAGEPGDPATLNLRIKDVERWERGVAIISNALAYTIARSSNLSRRESRAFELSRFAIGWYRGQIRSCSKVKHSAESMRLDPSALGSAVDTYAYLVLASEAASRRPNQERIGCAYAVFETLRDQELENLANVAKNELRKPDGRIAFERARLTLNVMQGHVQLAASALKGREPKCSTEDRIRMEKGNISRD